MHFKSFIPMALAVSTFFSSGSLAMPHGHSHQNLHKSHLVPKYAHSSRDMQKRDGSMDALKGEATSFGNWMSSFIKNGTTSASAIGALQEEVSAHIDAVNSFISSKKSSADASGDVLDQLSTDVDSFKVWIDTWVQDVSYTTSSDAINQLSNEMVQYNGWLNALLGTSTPASPPSSLTSGSGATTDVTTTVQQTSTAFVVDTVTLTGTPPAETQSSSVFVSAAPATSTTLLAQPSSVSSSSSVVANAPTSSVASQPSAAAPPPKSNSAPKLAAWWGQSSASSTHSLNEICNDESFDIVMLSFLNDFFSGGGLPTLNLGAATGSPSAAQSAAGATGLFSGLSLVPAIQACQSSGKKVMLTLGGAAGYSQSAFTGDNQASQFAETLWNLFLGGSSELRPFGSDIKLDGIDVDNENKDQTGYTAFVSALRSKFSGDSSKEYLISAAPQCVRPDASIPLDAMKQMDIVWVQFYNNPSCNHGTSGFTDSVKAWSNDLAGSSAKLYIGAISDVSQGSGFIDTSSLVSEVAAVQALGLPNYGGYALWDAALAAQNGNMQNSIKAALS